MKSRLFMFLLAVTVCGCSSLTDNPSTRSGRSDSAEDVERLQAQLIELGKELEAANQRFIQVKAEAAAARDESHALELELNAAQQNIDNLNNRLSDAGKGLHKLLENFQAGNQILSELEDTLPGFATDPQEETDLTAIAAPGNSGDSAESASAAQSEPPANAGSDRKR